MFEQGETLTEEGEVMELYLWVDRHDNEMVSLGTTRKTGGYFCWGQMHIDGIGETFGEGVKSIIVTSLITKHPPVHCLKVSVDNMRMDDEPI